MHILVEGAIMESRYDDLQAQNVMANYNATNAIGGLAMGSAVGSYSFTLPTPKFVAVPYKIIVDSKVVMLFATDAGYWADVNKQVLKLTEEGYKDLVNTLNRINESDALLANALNEMKVKVEGKKLEDVWNKQQVNGLLGLEV